MRSRLPTTTNKSHVLRTSLIRLEVGERNGQAACTFLKTKLGQAPRRTKDTKNLVL